MIIVVDIVDVVPVFVTLYPSPVNKSTASCNFDLLPLPFNISIFISSFEILVVLWLDVLLFELVVFVVLVEFVSLPVELSAV